MKTEFLANVSHELRTPLTPVRGYAELLRRRRGASPDEVAQHAAVISAAADRMGRVVDLLVDVAAIDAGRVSPELTPMQIGPFLEERLSAWWARQPERRDDLRGEWPPRLPSVSSDPRWLAKAVDELLDNALKYTEAGTDVRLEASRHGDRVRLAVHDAGRGLDETARPLLYDDFAQADGSVTRAQDGLGLGLPFVRRVAALFDLDLVVDSEPGRGAVFALDVPLAPRPVPQRTTPAQGVADRPNGTPLSGSTGGGTSAG
jgi:signal transduction histidine kinase